MPPVGFEPTISAGERPQTYALDRAATGTSAVIQLLSFKQNNLPWIKKIKYKTFTHTMKSVNWGVTNQNGPICQQTCDICSFPGT